MGTRCSRVHERILTTSASSVPVSGCGSADGEFGDRRMNAQRVDRCAGDDARVVVTYSAAVNPLTVNVPTSSVKVVANGAIVAGTYAINVWW